jgi:hypothetical protein
MDISGEDAADRVTTLHSRPTTEERTARHPAPSESAHQLGSLASELKEYASYFLSAKADRVKASVRNVGVYAALGVIGLIALTAMISAGIVLVLLGAAGGIAAALGGNLWLGGLIMGAFVLLCIGLGAYIGLTKFARSMRAKTVNKYEQRQRWQRGRFGRDVHTAAAKGK